MKYLLFVFALILLSNHTLSQSNEKVTLKWLESTPLSNGSASIEFPSFENRNIQGSLIYYVNKIESKTNYIYNTTNVVSELASEKEIKYCEQNGIDLNAAFQIEVTTKFAGTKMYKSVQAIPYARINGEIKRLLSFEIVTIGTNQSASNQKSYKTMSILASGDWYKIKVSKSGIYKVDAAFLQSAGIPSSVNPNHINIYGNGFGVLPEKNSIFRPDDLLKLSIQGFGEGDNQLNTGDYFLFYAEGPNSTSYSSINGLNTVYNDYEDYSYYFIHVDANDLPLRMQNATLSSLPNTTTVSSFDDFGYHQVDNVNLIRAGRRFYGELFDTQLSYSFDFPSQNIVSNSPVKVKYSYAFQGGSFSLNAKINGVNFLAATNNPYPNYVRFENDFTYTSSANNQNIVLELSRSNPSVSGHLDRIDLTFRRNLIATSGQMTFSDGLSVGASNVSLFQISNMDGNKTVWEVTENNTPLNVLGNLSGGVFEYKMTTDILRTFIINDGTYLNPSFVSTVVNQNLHALPFADFLIITPTSLIVQANRLADLHRTIDNIVVHVATTEQVYNEFSSGGQDPSAIRMFIKMFRDRAIIAGTPNAALKNVLLFGEGSYDAKNRIPGNINLIPTHQVAANSSEEFLSSMVTDDFYGLLDDTESVSPSDDLDLGIGRIVVTNEQQANEQVARIENYMKNGTPAFTDANGNFKTFGDWRLNYDIVADDVDEAPKDNDFVPQCETVYNAVTLEHPEIRVNKGYMDAFQQQITSTGAQRYPGVNDWINAKMNSGSLVMNYVGHGGETQMARELIISKQSIETWKNINQGLFVSATCEFGRYDDPGLVSAGETVSLKPLGGSIAVLTTSRPVYIYTNGVVISRFADNVFDRDANGLPLAFGEIVSRLKNQISADGNKRAFTLLGDPALRMPLPLNKMKIDSINGFQTSIYLDTLKALSLVEMRGHVDDLSNNLMSSFNGKATVVIYDKIVQKQTLGQDAGTPLNFNTQNNALFRGKVTVTNGVFKVKFIVPKDINFSLGLGKMSLYADDNMTDAGGVSKSFYIGGVSENAIEDNKPPVIDGYFNDPLFAQQGLTSENPSLQVKLTDDFGINAVGNGIGHDITAVLDGDVANPIKLNDFYETDLDSYTTGKIKFQMRNIPIGKHSLVIKAWDVNNNSGQDIINFEVAEQKELTIAHVLNYPNPFTTSTNFFFEHNQSCSQFKTQIQIFTISGKLVKTINADVALNGFRSDGIPWDGTDDYNDILAKGVYIYNLKAISCDGKIAEKTEKLVLLR